MQTMVVTLVTTAILVAATNGILVAAIIVMLANVMNAIREAMKIIIITVILATIATTREVFLSRHIQY